MTTTQNLQNSVVAESLIAALLLVRLNAADATVGKSKNNLNNV